MNLASELLLEYLGGITPKTLKAYFEKLGWKEVESAHKNLTTFQESETTGFSVYIPSTTEIDDYWELVYKLVETMAEITEQPQKTVVAAMKGKSLFVPKPVVFHSWEVIDSLVNKNEYVGLLHKIHLAENLYIKIEVRNISLVYKDGEDQIFFGLTTNNGFSIADGETKYCEQGYWAGLNFLLEKADIFVSAFEGVKKAKIDGAV